MPKARFHPSIKDAAWEDIIGVGDLENAEWANGINQIVEMDLFDISGVPIIIERYLEEPDAKELGGQLELMASIRMFGRPGLSGLFELIVTQGGGALALMNAEKISDLLRRMVESNAQRTCVIIQGLVRHGASVYRRSHSM